MPLLLIGAALSLVGWAALTFGGSVTTGAIHLLLAVGITLLVAWWALRT